MKALTVEITYICPSCGEEVRRDKEDTDFPTVDVLEYDENDQPTWIGMFHICPGCEELVELTRTVA